MKRDFRLMRHILLSIETGNNYLLPYTERQEDINEHTILLEEAGYLSAVRAPNMGGGYNIYSVKMTNSGYDILELIRNADIFEGVMDALDPLQCYNIEIIELLAKKLIKEKTGLIS